MQEPATKIVVLGTGGTIAGLQTAGPPGTYRAGALPLAQLLPEGADLERVDVAHIDSKDMDLAVWRQLTVQVAQALGRDEVAGVVITHGSDTLEDTAWLLHSLFASSGKPVVLTCAMRPADHPAPDGPGNWRDALAVARDGGAGHRGVLVVCAGQVHGARGVRKQHGWAVDAFGSGQAGALGAVNNGQVHWFREPIRPAVDSGLNEASAVGESLWRTLLSPPWPEQLRTQVHQALLRRDWPWVAVVHSAALADARSLRALVDAGVQGLVVAGTGSGTVHRDWLPVLASLPESVPWVLCSACEMAGMPLTEQAGWSALDLTPRKARISLALMQLALG
ncbi:hypothetical protein CCO03_08280 [Comamonas serinivorans]|uniref:L-asparaginase n=1 Tax=Comamonas serinivorans TaxID=1082851 RepID=A0A1Y0EMM5_9BURK|nr:asparaginase [Comamonas serinivorans]ARU04670.1 hypothetical protein CCO03_08280 [Comamonas serinivorans]